VEGSTYASPVYDYDTSDEDETRLTPLCPSKSPTLSRSTSAGPRIRLRQDRHHRRQTRTTSRTASSTQRSLGRGEPQIFWTPETNRLCSRVFSGVRVQRTSRFCRPAVASRRLPDPGVFRRRGAPNGVRIQRASRSPGRPGSALCSRRPGESIEEPQHAYRDSRRARSSYPARRPRYESGPN